MHRIEYVEGDQWKIIDGSEQTVFLGTKQQVEDWLDFRENIQRDASPRISLRGLVHALVQPLVRLASRLDQQTRHQSLGR